MKRILLLISFLSFLFSNYLLAQCPTCKLSGWQYAKEITIDNTGIANGYTNHQELLLIDTQTPISQGKMNSSGNDIRFIDSDCNTPLCYFIETGINTASTKIWVLLPSLAANSSKTIFMFYGNTTAAANSNFNCVFPSVLTINSAVTLTGNQNYDWIDVQAGGSITLGAGQILNLKARKIIISGNINGNNKGYGAAAGPGKGGNGGGSDGGGGGGYGGIGGSGKCPGGNSGSAYGTANGTDIDMGSGGGGSDCNPNGGGGGAIKLEAADINISASISMNGFTTGGNCSEEAAGGGSGGGILVYSDYINGTGNLEALGGNGQNSQSKEGGGGGGGGRIKLFYCKANNFGGTTNVGKGTPGSGGQCSANDAQDGTSTVNAFSCETITVGPEQTSAVANAGPDVAFCSGSSASIGSAPITGHTYSWSPTTGLSSTTVSNPTVIISNSGSTNIVTNYIVTATLGSCSVTDTVQVTVYPLPTSTFTATGPVCVGEGSVISYTGNAGVSATYVWDFDSATVISGSGQGPYNVTWDTSGSKNITLSVIQNGCISSTTTIITTVNPPNANAGPDVSICSGNNVTIGSPANTGYIYSWSPQTNLDNSSSSSPMVIQVNITGNPITTEYVVTTSFAGCTVTDTVFVTVYPEPISDAGPDVNYCSGNSAVIGTSNNSAYTYSWNPSNGLSSTSVSSPTVTLTNNNTSPLIVPYIVTTTHSTYNCTSSDTVNVTVFQIPTSLFSVPDSVCVNENVSISYTGTASAAASYAWSYGGGNASPGIGQGPHSVFWSNTGNASVSLQVTENTCVSNLTSYTVFVKPIPVSSAGPDVSFCSGTSSSIGVASTPGYTYLWSPTAGLSSNTASNPGISLTNTSNIIETHNYIVTTTALGCNSADTVIVTVYPIPVADFSPPSAQCLQNNSFSFSAGGTFLSNAVFSWNFGNNASPQMSASQNPNGVSFSTSGTQTIMLTISQYGCTSSVYVDSVMVYPMPQIIYSANVTSGCQPLAVQLTNNSVDANSFLWEFGDGVASTNLNPQHIYLSNGTYTVSVTATSVNGCVSTDNSTMITVWPSPVSMFNYEPEIITNLNPKVTFFDKSYDNIVSWTWNIEDAVLSSQNPVHLFKDTGEYCVELIVANNFGCKDTIEKCLRVLPDFAFYVANAFTPNGDGKNDVFGPTSIGIDIDNFELLIFNRWGDLIYKTDNINKPWNGKTTNDIEAETGVYIWKITLRDVFRKAHEYSGHVTLIR